MSVFLASWHELKENFKWRRLFTEEPGVKSARWSGFSTDPGHIYINIVHVIVLLVASPVWVLFFPKVLYNPDEEKEKKKNWTIEVVHTPRAILNHPRAGTLQQAMYDTPHNLPKWMVKITFEGKYAHFKQIQWDSIDVSDSLSKRCNYAAISYSFESAEAIYLMREGSLPSPDGLPGSGRKYSPLTRQKISGIVLREYIHLLKLESTADRVEYVWLDEFCLCEDLPPDSPEVEAQRTDELARLADIFSGASRVVILCHIKNCTHTTPDCPWGKRLFTLAEIYFAKSVQIMTLSDDGFGIVSRHGRDFKHDMQREATLKGTDKNWHLSAVMEHSSQSAAASWQLAIHYIIVEAIRRDLAGGFEKHEFLGRCLNGLLPRRSVLEQFSGNGWGDLSWMLELNQGYYNTSGLAAVCSLTEDDRFPELGWLGKPIAPKVGNERLEPIVTAFPVSEGLTFLSPKIIELKAYLERDGNALNNNFAMQGLKICSYIVSIILMIVSLAAITSLGLFFLALVWVACFQYVLAYLVAGSMYVKRDKWFIFDGAILDQPTSCPPSTLQSQGYNASNMPIPTGQRGRFPLISGQAEPRPGVNIATLSNWLKKQDSQLGKLELWGRDQLAPEWESPDPRRRPSRTAVIVDLQQGVYSNTIVANKENDGGAQKSLKLPDLLVPLAVHGCGITCMVLESYEDPMASQPLLKKMLRELVFLTDPAAQKMGMVNLPPHVLNSGKLFGSLRVGKNYPKQEKEKTFKSRSSNVV